MTQDMWILVMCCIAIGVVVVWLLTRKKNKPKASPPPLPRRTGSRVTSVTPRTGSQRTTQPVARDSNDQRRTAAKQMGPRGIRPDQFPCCPYDKQRNVMGAQQVIFWDSGENCYRCSRGHQFKANGRIM